MVVEKIVHVGKTTLIAKYDPETGELAFAKKDNIIDNYLDLIGENAITVTRSLREAFKDTYMPKISFEATGMTRREADIKDRFYRRLVEREGYQISNCDSSALETRLKRGIFSGVWRAPYRVYELNR